MARGKSGMCYTSLGKLKIQDSTIYSHKDNNQKDFECKKNGCKKKYFQQHSLTYHDSITTLVPITFIP